MRTCFSLALLDDRHARQAVAVEGPANLHLPQEALVDLVDDLQVAGQQPLEQRHRPLLERLGQQRVVGVAEGVHG